MEFDFKQIKFNENQIKKINAGLDKYVLIMDSLKNKIDVVTNFDFQREFNGFYKIRRNAVWREKYYKIFEEMINDCQNSFDKILYAIFKQTGRVEASFTSKMLASINSSSPIWDTNVLHNLGLSQPKGKGERKLANATKIFHQIKSIYDDLLSDVDLRFFIEKFDKTFPAGKSISTVKKIDFYIWSN